MTPIPAWDARGVIPPYEARQPTGPDRSPYRVTLLDLVLHFGTSQQRLAILDGFLRFRKGIHDLGIQSGFQWVNGSFAENVEAVDRRNPNDVDVVTFWHSNPELEGALWAQPSLSDAEQSKQEFKVDAHWVDLGLPSEVLVQNSHYWYSVWSHSRRSDIWKGFLQIDLAPAQDEEAMQVVSKLLVQAVTA
jgi:hypothetical protein